MRICKKVPSKCWYRDQTAPTVGNGWERQIGRQSRNSEVTESEIQCNQSAVDGLASKLNSNAKREKCKSRHRLHSKAQTRRTLTATKY